MTIRTLPPMLSATQAGEICRSVIRRHPVRIAFAGRAGAGKNTIADLIRDPSWPVLNHADTMKEEVLEWLVDFTVRALNPESDAAFEHFASFMGISPRRIQDDLWDLLGPVYASFLRLYLAAKRAKLALGEFAVYRDGEAIDRKVAFIEAHKSLFRESLQLYGQVSKEITADPEYWVQRTIARSLDHPICFNCDTRFDAEMLCLRNCGWLGIYLDIDDETQSERRPELTEIQKNHISEWGIEPSECTLTIDGRKTPAAIALEIAHALDALVKRKGAV